MKHQNKPASASAGGKNEESKWCRTCYQTFTKDEFNGWAKLCWNCCSSIVLPYGVEKKAADVVKVALDSEAWYLGRIPKFETVDHRERIRILVLAAGQKINLPTDREKNGADRVRALVPEMDRDWNFVSWGKIGEILIPEKQTEVW